MTPREREEQAADIVQHLRHTLSAPQQIWLMSAIMGAITTAIQAASNEQLLRCRAKHGPPTLKVKKLHPDAILPTRAYGQAAAFDLYALDCAIVGNEYPAKVRTGIAVEIPPGYFGKIETRSGVALTGVFVTGGIIDSDYRGEIHVILNRTHDDPSTFGPGERIAQMLILPVFPGCIEEVAELSATERGDKGFGSTGR